MGAGVFRGSRSGLLVGARFGQHEIVRFVGHGGSASVFEARHLALGRMDALKILHEHLAASSRLSARFVREGRLAGQLRHPNIVDIVDVGVDSATPYLVMELLSGEDLRAALSRRKRLPAAEAMAILLPIASALAFAHARGVVHRDLKPANVFLSHNARGELVPKIVDFGLSRLTGSEESPPAMDGAIGGTVQYMAPEQTRSAGAATPRSDQYALAVVLYECLAGVLPFQAETLYGMLDAVRAGNPRPPSTVAADVPRALDAIVLRAMSPEPGDRFADMASFARELLPFADDEVAARWAKELSSRPPAARESGPRRAASVRMPAAIPPPESAPPPSMTLRAARRMASSVPAGAAPLQALPALPCAPGSSPFRIKGLGYRGYVGAVRKLLPGGVDELCAALDDARLHAFVRQPFLASAWYDVLPMYPLTAALAALVGRPYDAFVRAGILEQARHDALHVFHRMYDGATVEDLVRRMPRFDAQYFDFGRTVIGLQAPGHIVVELRETPAYATPWLGRMKSAYTEEAARILGARRAECVERPPAPAGSRDGFPLVSLAADLRWS
jgi:serine/threonine protein kinase